MFCEVLLDVVVRVEDVHQRLWWAKRDVTLASNEQEYQEATPETGIVPDVSVARGQKTSIYSPR